LAEARLPIILVCGDSDKTVPYEENGKILYERYKEMGGTIELILKEGCDHHPHSLEDPTPIVNFILKYQH
jgi:alpha-beta hydrolase superfamily lysophospholipase